MRRCIKIINCTIIVLALIISIVLIFGFVEKLINRSNSDDETLGYTNTGNDGIIYDNKQYVRNKYLRTVLLIGIDSTADADQKAEPMSSNCRQWPVGIRYMTLNFAVSVVWAYLRMRTFSP